MESQWQSASVHERTAQAGSRDFEGDIGVPWVGLGGVGRPGKGSKGDIGVWIGDPVPLVVLSSLKGTVGGRLRVWQTLPGYRHSVTGITG